MAQWQIGDEQAAFRTWLTGQALYFLEEPYASSLNDDDMFVDLAIEHGGAKFLYEVYVFVKAFQYMLQH